MTETTMKWLTPLDDSDGHAFPFDQVNDSTLTSLTALCDKRFPVDHVEDTLPRSFCQTCLVRLGEQLPDENRWQTGG